MSDNDQNNDAQQPGGVPPQQPPAAHPAPPAYGAPYAQPGPQYAQQPAPGSQPGREPSFFGALFDLSFSHFVTLKFAKVIFIILIVLAGLTWLGAIIGGFVAHPALGFVALLFGWIGPFIMLVIYRVGLEAAVALVRTAQNTSLIANNR